jgi:hypothetical protein
LELALPAPASSGACPTVVTPAANGATARTAGTSASAARRALLIDVRFDVMDAPPE